MKRYEKIAGVQAVRAALSTGFRTMHKLYLKDSIFELAEQGSLFGEYNYQSELSFRQLSQDTIHHIPARSRPPMKRWADIISIVHKAQLNGLEITSTSSKDCDRISQTKHHQGFVLDVDQYLIKSLDNLPQIPPQELWVVLDRVQDVQNMGALMRSCYFYGVDGIILTDQFTAPLNTTVSRSSAGALEFLFPRIYQDSSSKIENFLKRFKNKTTGSIISTVSPYSRRSQGQNDEIDKQSPEINFDRGPLCLLMGNEGTGLDPHFIQLSTTSMTIKPKKSPRFGSPSPYVDSLNVSVALGIFLDQITTKFRPE